MRDPLIKLAGVSRRYGEEAAGWALRGCDLQIDAGEFVTVIGPSGSGKSTLLNLIGLLDRPTLGRYEFRGRSVGDLPERARSLIRASEIGFVFQSFHLLDRRTAWDNVQLAGLYAGISRADRSRASVAALTSVGLGDRLDQQPAQMSGGERQRVAIARAIAARPALLLCDEPTGNLDTANSAGVLEHLSDLNDAGIAVVVITHDPTVAARGTRTVQIVDGELVEAER